MISRELRAAVPLVATLSAVLIIGVLFFSFSEVDAAFEAPTNEPTVTDPATITTTDTNTVYNINDIPIEPEDTNLEEKTITLPITTTVEPTNTYTTILAIALTVVVLVGIILIIVISKQQHGRRH